MSIFRRNTATASLSLVVQTFCYHIDPHILKQPSCNNFTRNGFRLDFCSDFLMGGNEALEGGGLMVVFLAGGGVVVEPSSSWSLSLLLLLPPPPLLLPLPLPLELLIEPNQG